MTRAGAAGAADFARAGRATRALGVRCSGFVSSHTLVRTHRHTLAIWPRAGAPHIPDTNPIPYPNTASRAASHARALGGPEPHNQNLTPRTLHTDTALTLSAH